MNTWNTALPAMLSELHRLEFDYDEGIDFEPFEKFFPAQENAAWFQAWTGNPDVDGAQFRVFGQDGTGGYAALWLIHPDHPIGEQPIVFLGSEGERGMVAINLDEYLWLLAGGVGPYEAVAYSGTDGTPNTAFKSFAQVNSKVAELSAAAVVARAKQAHPDFSDYIDGFCR